ncbi:Ribose transport system permease protein RbsC [Bacillus sonorensis]|uniref:Ribose transport system permease protein RbsC n=1 Tax=Bacillus sonorensis TaxID=119858 RepID=A0ABM6LCT4_9BACI|nr:Ribose transport system permease protein RbsC [Bacillus sonorensis]TWK80604.1 hypothetical protein CHCC20335_0558 [Bacillus paralicheniformis]GIN65115.1 hypothetical protein J41TS2_05360 [Bacillus sonorensis]
MKTQPANDVGKSLNLDSILQKLGPFLGLIILVVIVSLLNPGFLEPLNILNLLRQVAINALIAFGIRLSF